MKIARRLLAGSLVVALAAMPALSQAQGRGWHGGGHGWGWGPGWGWGLGGVALGVDLALLASTPSYYYGPPVVYQQPTVVYAPPPPVVYAQQSAAPAQPSRQSAPDPIVYPRNGQSAEQTESDRRACNSWATTQPRAMNDASVFQRATEACMDGRGYTLR